MTEEFEVECKSKTGENFGYLVKAIFDENGQNYIFNIHAIPPIASNDFFQVTVHIKDQKTAKTTAIYANDSYYRQKGIPETVLPLIASFLNRKLVSSSQRIPLLTGERRSQEATSMWERLTHKGIAIYNSQLDHYEIEPHT